MKFVKGDQVHSLNLAKDITEILVRRSFLHLFLTCLFLTTSANTVVPPCSRMHMDVVYLYRYTRPRKIHVPARTDPETVRPLAVSCMPALIVARRLSALVCYLLDLT